MLNELYWHLAHKLRPTFSESCWPLHPKAPVHGLSRSRIFSAFVVISLKLRRMNGNSQLPHAKLTQAARQGDPFQALVEKPVEGQSLQAAW